MTSGDGAHHDHARLHEDDLTGPRARADEGEHVRFQAIAKGRGAPLHDATLRRRL